MASTCPATRGKALCGLGYAHLGAHYDASRREAWMGSNDEPSSLLAICNAMSHPNNPRGSEVPCTFTMGHDGGHSWGDPVSWPDFPQSGRPEDPNVMKHELRIHAAEDRVDPGGIERAGDSERPRPIPLPPLPLGYSGLAAAQERRERERGGINPVLTGPGYPEAPSVQGAGAFAPGTERRAGTTPMRAYQGRFERLTAKGWEPISVPIPPEGHEARWNEMTQKWEFYRLSRVSDPVHPEHYKQHPSGVEAIDIIEHLDFNIGTAIKYLWRFKQKNGDEDLKKAIWYIDRELTRRAKFKATQSAGTGPAPDPSIHR